MKIESISFQILEGDPVEPEWRPMRTMREYPGSHKVRFGYRLFRGEGIRLEARPAYTCLLRIRTDENIETIGSFASGWGREDLEWGARDVQASVGTGAGRAGRAESRVCVAQDVDGAAVLPYVCGDGAAGADR